MKTKQVAPAWLVNYKPGYVGFTYRDNNILSMGITYFTRWNRLADIKVSHVFIVTGENQCVEAQASGVKYGDLKHYFNDPKCQVFFRKPRGYNKAMAQQLVSKAVQTAELGLKYAYGNIVAQFATNCAVGKALDGLTGGYWKKAMFWMFDRESSSMCSETLVQYILKPVIGAVGCLRKDPATVAPQELFEDERVFDDWNPVDNK